MKPISQLLKCWLDHLLKTNVPVECAGLGGLGFIASTEGCLLKYMQRFIYWH
jgi:hypothetical protein